MFETDFCRYLSKQSPFMGFLLLAFYPSVWSVLKLDVLGCCNQRRSKDSPNAFPWGHLAWDFAREKAPLNTVSLYVFRDERAASSIQKFCLGKTSQPDSPQFLKHTPRHLRLRAVQLHCGVIFSYELTGKCILSLVHWQIGPERWQFQFALRDLLLERARSLSKTTVDGE